MEYPVFNDPPDEIYLREHLLRYEFSLPYIQGMRVLDIGCGARRGPFLMAQKASLVIGTDASPQAVQQAGNNWKAPRLFYTVMHAQQPCFQTSAFDVVTCFEVIEHLPEPSATLSAIARILQPDGLFILSTPNKIRSQEKGEDNPHHVREFSHEELEFILGSCFSTTTFFSMIRTRRAEALLNARKQSYRFTRWDPLGFRRFIPSNVRKWFYDRLTLVLAGPDADRSVHLNSFDLHILPRARPDACYFIAVCRRGMT